MTIYERQYAHREERKQRFGAGKCPHDDEPCLGRSDCYVLNQPYEDFIRCSRERKNEGTDRYEAEVSPT